MADGESPLDGFTSLLRLSGYHVPARAKFVGESFFAGIYTATTLGLLAGQVGMWFTPVGPALPFLTASTLGFGLGMFENWRQAVDRTKQYARHYPQILAHALWVEHRVLVPEPVLRASVVASAPNKNSNRKATSKYGSIQQQQQSTTNTMVDWVTNQGVRHLSMCMFAAQSCRSDVEEVEKQERQRILDATVARLAANASDDGDHDADDDIVEM